VLATSGGVSMQPVDDSKTIRGRLPRPRVKTRVHAAGPARSARPGFQKRGPPALRRSLPPAQVSPDWRSHTSASGARVLPIKLSGRDRRPDLCTWCSGWWIAEQMTMRSTTENPRTPKQRYRPGGDDNSAASALSERRATVGMRVRVQKDGTARPGHNYRTRTGTTID
jgi:hypothetical protein